MTQNEFEEKFNNCQKEIDDKVNEHNECNSNIAKINQHVNTWLTILIIQAIISFLCGVVVMFLTVKASSNDSYNGVIVATLCILVPLGLAFIHFMQRFINDHKISKICKQRQTIEFSLQELHTKKRLITEDFLSSSFNITREQLNYDLTGILNAHPNLKHRWYETSDTIDVVSNALNAKYFRNSHAIEKSALQIEKLKLENEGIAIDNKQKKFWTCTFCGNMNRADDMQCIKCGGQRVN